MKYIYDIILNFQNKYYDFYEWKKEDIIKNIKKIPLYRINNNDFKALKYNEIIIEKNLIEKIKRNKNTYICIFSNTISSIAIKFNNKGYLIKRSSLIFEEEEEANRFATKLPLFKIKYIKNIKKKPNNKLRIEIDKKKYIINYLHKNNNLSYLKYLYYDYFEKECNNINKIKKELINETNKKWTSNQINLYNNIKLLKNTLKIK